MQSDEVWPRVEAAIRTHRSEDLKRLLIGMGDADRKACVAPLRAFVRTGPDDLPPWDYFGGIAMAGAAVLPDARSVASWLRRHEARDLIRGDRHREVSLHAQVGDVLVARNPAWLGNVVAQWGEAFRANEYDPDAYRLLERLREHTDAAPPPSHGYVAAWVFFEWLGRAGHALVDPVQRVTRDPRFAELVPIVPDVDDVAWDLENSPSVFPRVVDAPPVDRDRVLDAVLARLQRGGRPGHLKSWVAVWSQLAPTTDELAARIADLVAMLSVASAVVVRMAQQYLFRLDDDHRLEPADLLEAGRILLPRSEKKIVRDTLTRLRNHASAHPDQVGRVASVVAAGLGSPAVDLQRDAAKLLVALGGTTDLDVEVVDEVRRGVEQLPADLRPLLDPLLGTPAGHTTVRPTEQITASPSPGKVDPISGHAELIEELLVLVRGEGNKMGGVALERVSEAIPRLVARPGPAGDEARDAARAVLDSPEFAWIHQDADYRSNYSVRRGLFALLAAACGTPLPAFVDRLPSRERPPQQVLSRRLFALAGGVATSPAVRSVSLPTDTTGSISAADVLVRLREAAAAGWEPESIDLEQALLRTEPHVDDRVVAQLAALGSPAANRATRWLSGNAPSTPPTTLRRIKEYRDTQYDDVHWRPPPPDSYLWLPTFDPSAVEPDEGVLWPVLLDVSYPATGFHAGWKPEAAYEAWPLLLPHHREVIAVHVLPDLTRGRTASCQADVALATLAQSNGPVGPALLTACLHAAAAKTADNRASGVDALLTLAARGQLDAGLFADVLLQLLSGRDVSVKRLVPALVDIANGGAANQLLAALSIVIDRLVADDAPAVTGLADLLSATAHTALLAPDAPAAGPGLRAFATKRGSSRQLIEARRLLELLPSH